MSVDLLAVASFCNHMWCLYLVDLSTLSCHHLQLHSSMCGALPVCRHPVWRWRGMRGVRLRSCHWPVTAVRLRPRPGSLSFCKHRCLVMSLAHSSQSNWTYLSVLPHGFYLSNFHWCALLIIVQLLPLEKEASKTKIINNWLHIVYLTFLDAE